MRWEGIVGSWTVNFNVNIIISISFLILILIVALRGRGWVLISVGGESYEVIFLIWKYFRNRKYLRSQAGREETASGVGWALFSVLLDSSVCLVGDNSWAWKYFDIKTRKYFDMKTRKYFEIFLVLTLSLSLSRPGRKASSRLSTRSWKYFRWRKYSRDSPVLSPLLVPTAGTQHRFAARLSLCRGRTSRWLKYFIIRGIEDHSLLAPRWFFMA